MKIYFFFYLPHFSPFVSVMSSVRIIDCSAYYTHSCYNVQVYLTEILSEVLLYEHTYFHWSRVHTYVAVVVQEVHGHWYRVVPGIKLMASHLQGTYSITGLNDRVQAPCIYCSLFQHIEYSKIHKYMLTLLIQRILTQKSENIFTC